MNSNNKKPTAKNLLKNKEAMARLREERAFRNYMTRKTNMTKAGNLPRPKMLTLNKKKPAKPANKTNVTNKVNKPATAKKNTNNNGRIRSSMHAYKHFMAIPFAKLGLHDPKAPNYHNELVQNMKEYQRARPELVPMHNKDWFVNQLKRNVWALQNNRAVEQPRCPMVSAKAPVKTHRLLNARKGVKAAKPKTLTEKQLTKQLKEVTARLKAQG